MTSLTGAVCQQTSLQIAHLDRSMVIDIHFHELQRVAVQLLQLLKAWRLLRSARRRHHGVPGPQNLHTRLHKQVAALLSSNIQSLCMMPQDAVKVAARATDRRVPIYAQRLPLNQADRHGCCQSWNEMRHAGPIRCAATQTSVPARRTARRCPGWRRRQPTRAPAMPVGQTAAHPLP